MFEKVLATTMLVVVMMFGLGASVYDVTGRKVYESETNSHWDGRNTQGQRVAPGIYFTRTKTESSVVTRKVVVGASEILEGDPKEKITAPNMSNPYGESIMTGVDVFDLGKVSQALQSQNWIYFASILTGEAQDWAIDPVALDCSNAGDDTWNSFVNIMVALGYPAPVRPGSGTLQASDIKHLYTFKLAPKTIFGTGKNIFSNGDLAYDPATDRLFLWSKSGAQEISIPDPVPGLLPSDYVDNPGVCPVSDIQGSRWADELVRLMDPAKTFGGFEAIGNDFVYGYYDFYATNYPNNDRAGIGMTTINFNNPQGPWRVGPSGVHSPYTDMYHMNKTHQIIMRGDPAWISRVTGKDPDETVFGFRWRPAGAFGGGKGPHLYIFDKPNSLVPVGGDLNGKMLMSFQGKEWENGYFRNSDGEEKVCATWVYGPGFSTVLYGMTKGNMTVQGAQEAVAMFNNDPAYHANGPNFYGPDHPSCGGQNKGWKAWPYTPECFMYDASLFEEVYKGNMSPRSSLPFYDKMDMSFIWRVGADGTSLCERRWVAGMTYDPNSRRLFILELEAYQDGSSWLPVIHVLGVKQ